MERPRLFGKLGAKKVCVLRPSHKETFQKLMQPVLSGRNIISRSSSSERLWGFL